MLFLNRYDECTPTGSLSGDPPSVRKCQRKREVHKEVHGMTGAKNGGIGMRASE